MTQPSEIPTGEAAIKLLIHTLRTQGAEVGYQLGVQAGRGDLDEAHQKGVHEGQGNLRQAQERAYNEGFVAGRAKAEQECGEAQQAAIEAAVAAVKAQAEQDAAIEIQRAYDRGQVDVWRKLQLAAQSGAGDDFVFDPTVPTPPLFFGATDGLNAVQPPEDGNGLTLEQLRDLGPRLYWSEVSQSHELVTVDELIHIRPYARGRLAVLGVVPSTTLPKLVEAAPPGKILSTPRVSYGVWGDIQRAMATRGIKVLVDVNYY